jgi:hypothetical protein
MPNVSDIRTRIPLGGKAKTELTPDNAYDASQQGNVAVSVDGLVQKLQDRLTPEPDIQAFDFNLYFPSGETTVSSNDFVPFYGSHRKVWDALLAGRLHFDDASAALELIEYFYKTWPSEMKQIPSIAYKAKVIGW